MGLSLTLLIITYQIQGTKLWLGLLVWWGLALGQSVNVAATTTVIAHLVHEMGGNRVRMVAVVPMGVGPHSFEPRPSMVQAISGSRLLFANGMNLEAFLNRIASQLPRGVQVVRLAEGLPDPITV